MTNPKLGGWKRQELILTALKMRVQSKAGKRWFLWRRQKRILPCLFQLLVKPDSLDLKQHKPGLHACLLSFCLSGLQVILIPAWSHVEIINFTCRNPFLNKGGREGLVDLLPHRISFREVVSWPYLPSERWWHSAVPYAGVGSCLYNI